MPSFKFTTKARGVFSTGNNGFGFVVIDPFQMLCNDGGFEATNLRMGGSIYYTDKTNDLTTLQFTDGTTLNDGVVIGNSNSLFTTAEFDVLSGNPTFQNRHFRLVGAGLRINYIGSNMYNAGRIIVFRNQANVALEPSFSYTSDNLLQDNYTVITANTRASRYVYYVPDTPVFIAYSPYNAFSPNLTSGSGRGTSHHCMGLVVDGGAISPNQQSWEYEAVAFFECIGGGFTLSRSEGDPVGHDVLMASLPNKAPTSSPQQVEGSVMNQFIKGLSETTREVAYNVGRKALGYAASAAVSYMNPSTRLLSLMPS
jgi:hypothetical protein